MKESWSYFDYMRRWWWLLLIISIIGFLIGLVYPILRSTRLRLTQRPRLPIEDRKTSLDYFPVVLVNVQTGGVEDAIATIDSAASTISAISEYSEGLVTIRELRVNRNVDRGGWWKSPVMGTVIGILVAIGGIYVIEDALSYHRHRLKGRQAGFYSNGLPTRGEVPLPNANAAADMQDTSKPEIRFPEEWFELPYQRAR